MISDFASLLRSVCCHTDHDGTPQLSRADFSHVLKLLDSAEAPSPLMTFMAKVLRYLEAYLQDNGVAPSIDGVYNHTVVHIVDPAKVGLNNIPEGYFTTLETPVWGDLSVYLSMTGGIIFHPNDMPEVVQHLVHAIQRELLFRATTKLQEGVRSGGVSKSMQAFKEDISILDDANKSLVWEHAQSTEDAEAAYERSWLEQQKAKRLYTGFKAIDDKFKGFLGGSMIGVVGAPGHGKSKVCENIALRALKQGMSGIYISLEMDSALECQARFYSLHSGDPKFAHIHPPLRADDIMGGNLTPEAKEFLFKVVQPDFQALPGKLTVISPDSDTYGYQELKQDLIRYDLDPAHPLAYFVLDYPDLMTKPNIKGNQSWQNVNYLYRQLKKICGNHMGRKLIGLMPVQPNDQGIRDAAKHSENAYSLGCIATSSEIAKSCTLVLYISSFDLLHSMNQGIIGTLKDRLNYHPKFMVNVNPVTGLMTQAEVNDCNLAGKLPTLETPKRKGSKKDDPSNGWRL